MRRAAGEDADIISTSRDAGSRWRRIADAAGGTQGRGRRKRLRGLSRCPWRASPSVSGRVVEPWQGGKFAHSLGTGRGASGLERVPVGKPGHVCSCGCRRDFWRPWYHPHL